MAIDRPPEQAVPADDRITVQAQQQGRLAGKYVYTKARNYFFDAIITYLAVF
jgi:hypothetical protein